MPKLKVNRYINDPSHCVAAAVACVSNYYNTEINYEIVKNFIYKNISNEKELGLNTGETGRLLNYLGFNKVTIISSELHYLDYSWSKFSKKKLLETLKENKNKVKGDWRIDWGTEIKDIYKWLKDKKYNNNLVIDYNFGKYIRKFIDQKKPVLVSFNWTQFFKYSKEVNGVLDPIRGEWIEHLVVIYGYDKKSVNICDSHNEYYRYRLKRYRKGFYKISWENLMSIMGYGDVILADNFDKNALVITEK